MVQARKGLFMKPRQANLAASRFTHWHFPNLRSLLVSSMECYLMLKFTYWLNLLKSLMMFTKNIWFQWSEQHLIKFYIKLKARPCGIYRWMTWIDGSMLWCCCYRYDIIHPRHDLGHLVILMIVLTIFGPNNMRCSHSRILFYEETVDQVE